MTYWEEVAEFETDADIDEYEEAERVSDKSNNDYRCVGIRGEVRYLVEIPSDDNVGWAKVCNITWNGNAVNGLSEDIADSLPDDYRVVYVYDEDEYVVERYYE